MVKPQHAGFDFATLQAHLDDMAQIYVIDVARGGEAERITSLSTGARTAACAA